MHNKDIEIQERKSGFFTLRLKQIPQPELTPAEKDEIDAFWGRYGIRIHNYDPFRWYYGVSGMRDPRFISPELYSFLIPFLNDQKLAESWRDRNFYDQRLPMLKFPNTVLRKVNFRYYAPDGTYLDEAAAEALLKSYTGSRVMFKPGFVRIGMVKNKTYFSAEESISRLMHAHREVANYIVIEPVKRHPFLALIRPGRDCYLQLNTVFAGGKAHLCDNAMLRYGNEGDHRYVGIWPKDGRLGERSISMKGDWQKALPAVSEKEIPYWDRIVDAVLTGAYHLPYFNYVSWRVVMTDEGEPVILEYRIRRPDEKLCQYFGPMFGEQTEAALSPLLDERQRRLYVPKEMRL